MNYQKYKVARDEAWRLLIKYNISSLPVKITDICKGEGIVVRSYTQAREFIKALGFEGSTLGNDGFAVCVGGQNLIFYDDICTIQRQRFTIAHELGHIVLGDVGKVPTCRNKEPSTQDDECERMANVVAARVLAPACVLWGVGVNSAEDISKLCDISFEAAQWRMQRMKLLYEREEEFLHTKGRSCFLLSASERRVYEQFREYINKNRITY